MPRSAKEKRARKVLRQDTIGAPYGRAPFLPPAATHDEAVRQNVTWRWQPCRRGCWRAGRRTQSARPWLGQLAQSQAVRSVTPRARLLTPSKGLAVRPRSPAVRAKRLGSRRDRQTRFFLVGPPNRSRRLHASSRQLHRPRSRRQSARRYPSPINLNPSAGLSAGRDSPAAGRLHGP